MTATDSVVRQGADLPHVAPRHVAAAVVGNWLEFYDFVVYTYFAIQIGDAFFPAHSAFGRLMLSLITFGVGFFLRPVGAVVFGYFADRAGRRPAMLVSFMMMGGALTAFVLIPSYAQIGIWAPILAVVCRMVQGFALGGEVGPTTAFLIESAPFRQRGLFGAWQSGSQSLAQITAGVAGLSTAAFLSSGQMHDWGWRVALGVGALMLPFGLIIRRTLPETRHHEEPKLDVHPEHDAAAGWAGALLAHWRVILLGLGIIAGGTIATYVNTYMTTYAQTTLHMSLTVGLMVAVANGCVGFVGSLGGGWLSDRFGRRPLMIWPRLAYLLMILPVFMLVVKIHTPLALIGLMATMGIVGNLAGVPAFVAVVESLRKDVRGIATGTIYATAVAVFGGTTQPIVAWLGHVTNNPLAIAYYLMFGTAIALVASVLMTETVIRAKSG
jgi:MHS family citrate/tricarballylate:H+ symporter-like MFS transporter